MKSSEYCWRLSVAIAFAVLTGNASAATLDGGVSSSGASDPIAGARVTLFTSGLGYFAETRTDVAGLWVLTGVPDGTYTLGVAVRGYEYVESTINVMGASQFFAIQLVPEAHPGDWNIIGTTYPEFLDATDIAYLTPAGTVFFCHDTTDPIHFDPVTGLKTFPSGSGLAQGCMNGTVLGDGRLIFVGGQDGSDPGSFQDAVRWVKTWTLSTSWLLLPELVNPTGRWYPGLARLADGSLLVMGGGTAPSAERTDTCERFDLATQTWSATGSMLNPCEFPPSALLANGKVLITWSPPQLYDPVAGAWQLTGNFVQPNRGWPGHSDHSVVVLADGRVLAIGTRSNDLSTARMAEIYDPVTETWSVRANSGLVREQPEVVQLPDGRIFVGAGQARPPYVVPEIIGRVLWTDLYDPGTDSWRRVADMQQFREYHAVTLLIPDGRVLTTGGTQIAFVVGPTSADIEAFSPPYLFRGVRPQIAAISTNTPRRGAVMELEIAPLTQLTSVVLMGSEVVTHWVSGGVPRRLELPVTQVGNTATITLPNDANQLPLGWYLLFAMVDDIPSVARIINIVNEVQLVRGDCNDDSFINIADPVLALDLLFGTGSAPTCLDACDANDDGAFNIADPIFSLVHLFESGSAPPAPFPACGADPTADGLDCVGFAACP
ncbi:MAG: galactose oxidase-like domain-containing protein [Planctomycetota bacterium]